MKKSIVIFDFDGTIADTFPVILDIFHQVEHRTVPLNKEEEMLMRSAALMQVKLRVIVRAASKLNISFWRLPFIFVITRFLLKRRMAEVQPFEGIPEVIRALADQDAQLVIISANTKSNIKKFLKTQGLHKCFAKIYGSVRPNEKADTVKMVCGRYHIPPKKVFLVGDENRDIMAGHSAGVKTIAVTWGYNDVAQLINEDPTRLCNSPAELMKVLGGSKWKNIRTSFKKS